MAYGTTFGSVVNLNSNPTSDEFKKAKETVVDELCQAIRKVAETNPNFFIVNQYCNKTTVGSKIILPTIEEDVDY